LKYSIIFVRFLTRPPPPPPPFSPGHGAAGPASEPQAVGEDDPDPDGAEREAAAHAADLLQREPEARRADEGAAGGDDQPEPPGHPGLVPEQALQRQEEDHPDEAAAAAAPQRQVREHLRKSEPFMYFTTMLVCYFKCMTQMHVNPVNPLMLH